MDISETAELFERVQWRGAMSFMARCPVHEDGTASLKVSEGHSGIVMYCHAGCGFFAVVEALGRNPLDFKFGGESSELVEYAPSARTLLRQALRRSELVSLADVVTLALQPDDAQLARATERYPSLMELPYRQAMTMDRIVEVGPLFELLWDGVEARWGKGRYYPRFDTHDWFVARDQARREMAKVWRNRR